MIKKTILSVFIIMLVIGSLSAQTIKFPAVSQKATLTQTVGLTDVTLVYHRPGVKGRAIWGDLVPWDKVWRTGANNATTVEFSSDVLIEGQKLAAGKYALYTIPGQEEFVVIFNKQTDLWGDSGYDEKQDVLRVKVKTAEAPHCEWMNFGIDELSESSARIKLRWEKVLVAFKMEVDTKAMILASIDKTMNGLYDAPYRAAGYAFRNDMLDKAKTWIDTSVSLKPVYWNVLLQAKVYQKLAKTKADRKRVMTMLEKAVSLISALPEEHKGYAVEAAKLLEEMKAKK
jgi:hypothetical protein